MKDENYSSSLSNSSSTCSLIIKVISLTSKANASFSGKEIHDGFTLILSSSLDNGQPFQKDVSFIRKATKGLSVNESDSITSFPKLFQMSSSFPMTITVLYSDESIDVKINDMFIGKTTLHQITIKDLCLEFSSQFVKDVSIKNTKTKQLSSLSKKLIIPQMIPLKKNILEEIIANNYFECFFISGLSRFNPQLIVSNSSNYKSQCLHQECSKNTAYNPSIVYSFIKRNNSNIDLNEYTSKLCFPTGIKLCYDPKDQSLSKGRIINNVITGGNGNYYYLTALMFYIEFSIESFPFYFPDINLMVSKGNSVLLPFCFCLMSSYNNPQSTEEILTSLLDQYQSEMEIDQELLHLIYEVPSLPSIDNSMTIYLPKTQVRLSSVNPNEMNDIFIEKIVNQFSIECLSIIVSSLLIEHKVIVVSNSHHVLYNVILGLKAMIYPFKWRGTFIPIITEDSVKYAQSFIPFIMGIDREIFDYALQSKSFNNESDVLITDIDNKRLFTLRSNSMMTLYIKETITSEVSSYPISDYLKSKLSTQTELNKDNIKDCLLKAIAKLFINYQSYISFVGTNVLFNQTCFVSSIDKGNADYSHFYTELTSTQQFTEFLQEYEKEEYKYFNSLCVPKEKNGYSIDTLSNNDEEVKVVIHNSNENDFNLLPYFFNANHHHHSKRKIEADIKEYYSSIKQSSETVKYVLSEDAFIGFDLILKNTQPKELRLYNIVSQDVINDNNFDCQSLSSSRAMIESIDKDSSLNDNDIDKEKEKDQKGMRNSSNSRRSSNKNKTIPYRKTISIVNMVLHSNTFKEIEKYREQISELLRDYMGYVLINKQLPLLNSMSDFSLCFSKPIIRKEFAFIIYQEKFRQGYEHELIRSIFDHFSQMVFYVLLNTKDAKIEYENVRLITKSLVYYFTWKESNEKEYLYTPIVKHGIVFPFWTNKLFWEYYYKEELIENPLENINVKGTISKTMAILNIDTQFIDYCHMKVFK